ncbi:hypothetical protein HanRHA438_Chr08g0349181 [Helianthus annuus]|nr:hypothetical protein HanRHA438_Chr08g0349181 [Helianthus annuus]
MRGTRTYPQCLQLCTLRFGSVEQVLSQPRVCSGSPWFLSRKLPVDGGRCIESPLGL